MGRIFETFDALKAAGRKAFVGYAMAGYPDPAGSLELAKGLLQAGADLLEIGVPFSDPIADGPIIQRCAEGALAKGGSLALALEQAAALRRESRAPLLLMSYLNPLLDLGPEAFAARAREAGVDGAIVPDLTPEESKPIQEALRAEGLDLIFLAAPTSTPARLARIARAASGFIYVVSVTGVTGERTAFDERLASVLAGLRARSALPLCVGFGVSSPESARAAAGLADGVVAASTVLKEIVEGRGVASALAKASALIQAVHQA